MNLLFVILFLISGISYADTRTDQPGPLFGDVDGTNAGRYRSVKFTNGTTTNNSDGTVTINNSGSGVGSPWTRVAPNVYTTTASDNVGIGTIIPGYKLAVLGTVGIGTWTNASGFLVNIANGGVSLANVTTAGQMGAVNFDTGGCLKGHNTGGQLCADIAAGQMNFTQVSTNIWDRLNFGLATAANPSIGANGTSLSVLSGDGTFVANLGIGTKTANAKLEIVQPGTSPYMMLSSTATGAGDIVIATSAGNVGIGTINPQSKFSVGGNMSIGAADATIAAPANGALIQGNLGIGSFIAPDKLYVYGSWRQQNTVDGNDAMGFYSANGTRRLVMYSSGSYFYFQGETAIPMYFSTNAIARMAIPAAGGVGIGTTELNVGGVLRLTPPVGGLTVEGNTGIGLGNASPVAQLSVAGNVGIGTNGSSSFTRTTPPSGGMIVEGNIGIGSNIPTNILEIAGGSTSKAAMRLVVQSAPTTPDIGAIWNDTTQNMIALFNGNTLYQSGNLYTATANTTINSASPTSTLSGTKIGSTTIKANSAKVGQKFQIWGAGNYTTPLGNIATVTITTKIGAMTISTVTTGSLPASATNLPFDFSLQCTVQTAGASGKLVCNGSFNYATAVSAVAKTSNDLSTTAQVSVDFTADQALDVQANWSAVTTQTATVQQAKIDFL